MSVNAALRVGWDHEYLAESRDKLTLAGASPWGRAWFGSPLESDSNGLSPYPNAALRRVLRRQQGKRFLFGLDISWKFNCVACVGDPYPKVGM